MPEQSELLWILSMPLASDLVIGPDLMIRHAKKIEVEMTDLRALLRQLRPRTGTWPQPGGDWLPAQLS